MKKTTRFLIATFASVVLGSALPGTAAADGGPDQGQHNGPKACVKGQAQLDRNTETVIAYYTLSFNEGQPEEAVARYVGLDENGQKLYIQHNPLAADGPEAFIDFVNFFKGIFPDLNVNIVRTIAQCNLVMTHSHLTLFPGDLGTAVMDIFRLDETGRVVEHWDVGQDVPEESANDNGMF